MTISSEERAAFKEMAVSFAKRSVSPILAHESPDGDLAKVPSILDQAYETGLIASASPDAPGHDAGAWGSQTGEHGPSVSLMLLEELAVPCGGVAMNVHALGLGAMLLMAADNAPTDPPKRVAAALCEGGFTPGLGTITDPSLDAPARIETSAVKTDNGYKLTGAKQFVYAGHGTEAFVVFARMDKEWAAFLVAGDAKGLRKDDAGHRMGLRACPVINLRLDDVVIGAGSRLEYSRPAPEAVMEYLASWWLGSAAIATGVARGALAAADGYARERFQGCTEIINHPAMGSLLADSSSRIMACQALLARAAEESGSARQKMIAAAKAKLRALDEAARAVTDSLQVFGGYGYMEDYRMEKRFRDVNTLRSGGGGPRELRALVAAHERGE